MHVFMPTPASDDSERVLRISFCYLGHMFVERFLLKLSDQRQASIVFTRNVFKKKSAALLSVLRCSIRRNRELRGARSTPTLLLRENNRFLRGNNKSLVSAHAKTRSKPLHAGKDAETGRKSEVMATMFDARKLSYDVFMVKMLLDVKIDSVFLR